MTVPGQSVTLTHQEFQVVTETYAWKLDGVAQTATDRSIVVDTTTLDEGSHTVECEVTATFTEFTKDNVTLSCITTQNTTLSGSFDVSLPEVTFTMVDSNDNEIEGNTIPETVDGRIKVKVDIGDVTPALELSLDPTGKATLSPTTANDGSIVTVTGVAQGSTTLKAKWTIGGDTLELGTFPLEITEAPKFVVRVYSIGGTLVTDMEDTPVDFDPSGGSQAMASSATVGVSATGAVALMNTTSGGSGQRTVTVPRNEELLLDYATKGSWWQSLLGFTWDATWVGATQVGGTLTDENGQEYERATHTYTDFGSYTVTVTGQWYILWFIPTKQQRFTWNVKVIGLEILEMDFTDWKNTGTAGQEVANNFDIVDENGALIVPDGGPEWSSTTGTTGKTCYIKSTGVGVTLKVRSNPVVPNGDGTFELYSEGDLDFKPRDESNAVTNDAELVFDANGEATVTLYTDAQTALDTLKLKDYSITWKGDVAAEVSVTYPIYTLYGTPVDNFALGDIDQPSEDHLGHTIGSGPEEPRWAWGRSALTENDDASIPFAVRNGIRRDAKFNRDPNAVRVDEPWDILEQPGGLCEDYSALMQEALLVLGVEEQRLRRKSVVSSVVSRPAVFGITGEKKLLKAFVLHGDDTPYGNEGVCGVMTDGEVWRFYDVAGSCSVIGLDLGWNNPFDYMGGRNLWFEATPLITGPLIRSVFHSLYYEWEPTSEQPHEPDPVAIKKPFRQVFIDTQAISSTQQSCTVYTEGIKPNSGYQLDIYLRKRNAAGNWLSVTSGHGPIYSEWGFSMPVLLNLSLSPGEYRFAAEVTDSETLKSRRNWNFETDVVTIPNP